VELVTSVTDAGKASLITRALRLMGRGVLAFCCVCGCLTDFMFHAMVGRLNTRSRASILQRWSARLLSFLRVDIQVDGEIPQRGLIVSNHLSYLDILIYSAVSACVFVSKREVKSWPGVGWISSLSGTIYIDRARRTDTHSVQEEMQAPLSSGMRLVLFPEGTSSDGSRLLHFHSSLFQPAVDLKAPITAAAIDYLVTDGNAALEACYWGDMTLLPHVLNLLTKESVQATLRFSCEQLTFKDRKEAARVMQSRVEQLRSAAVRA
jgi:1-acyl-sn-glycerol-3-phosphate acyltransferase